MKYLLDLWSRVPYNPISLSEEGVIPTFFFFFPFAVAVDTLRKKSIPSIHHPSFLALLSSRYFLRFLIYYNRCPLFFVS
jgi:hypothetical protein